MHLYIVQVTQEAEAGEELEAGLETQQDPHGGPAVLGSGPTHVPPSKWGALTAWALPFKIGVSYCLCLASPGRTNEVMGKNIIFRAVGLRPSHEFTSQGLGPQNPVLWRLCLRRMIWVIADLGQV